MRPKGWTCRRHLNYQFLRRVVRLGILSNMWLMLPFQFKHPSLINVSSSPSVTTVDAYRASMKRQNSEPNLVTLESGATSGWIGSAKSVNILLYFHGRLLVIRSKHPLIHLAGGAYTSPAVAGHMSLLEEIVASAREEGYSLGLLVLCYG
jgi:hypothetical protein